MDSPAPAAPTFDSPIAPAGAGEGDAEKSRDTTALSFSMPLSWLVRRARAALALYALRKRCPEVCAGLGGRVAAGRRRTHLLLQRLALVAALRHLLLRDLVGLPRLVLQSIHLPVPSVRRANE